MPDRCIWCLRTHAESPPSREEHIIGSALGYPRDAKGAAFALRLGEVCTRCNNGRLSRLDRKIGDEFDLVRLVANVGDDPKPLRSRWNARAKRDACGHLTVAVNMGPDLVSDSPLGPIPPPRGDGRDVTFLFDRNEIQVAVGVEPELSHTVHKIAFEIFAKLKGWEPALERAFDPVRKFVMEGIGRREIIMGSALPSEEQRYENRVAEGMVDCLADGSVRASFVAAGVFFYTDLSENQISLSEVKHNIWKLRGAQNWGWFPNPEGRVFRVTVPIIEGR